MTSFNPVLHKAAKAVRKIIWKPLPGSQEMFLRLGQPESLVTEVLFHGSRGNGKSDALIMGFVQHVGKGWGPAWRGIILRKEYKNLRDIVKTSHQIIPRAFPGAKWSQSEYSWTFPTGEVLMFNHIKKPSEYDTKFHGWQLTYIAYDELATWATDEIYVSMLSTLRSAFIPTAEQPNMPPLQVRASTNPWGVGRHWVYKRFIEARKPGEIVMNSDGTRQRCALFGTIFENIYINKSYIKNFLMKLVDPAKRAAWLLGDWNAVDTSSMFGSVWSSRVVMKPFPIPKGWRIDRSFDFGQSTPYCGLWHAEANGEAATLPDGTRFCPPAGSIIVIGEDYGTEENARGEQVTPDAGLFLPARAIGKRLKDREKRLSDSGILGGHTIHPGAADSQIYNGKQVQGQQTVAAELEAEGMKFVPADKAPGSRVNSAQLAFQRLSATKANSPDQPHLYIFQGCRYLIACLPSIARDEDNMDACKKGPDDHSWDALAYRLTMKKSVTKVTNGIR
ncbi:hypothetical protein LZL36_11055 [Pseudomonas aeruginosa]|nr:hypothetical protein [Pseudomonas aeruginosa]